MHSGLQRLAINTLESALPTTTDSDAPPKATTSTAQQRATEITPQTTATCSPGKQATPMVKQGQASAGDLGSELLLKTLASTQPMAPSIVTVTLTLLSKQSEEWSYFSKRFLQTIPKSTIKGIYKIHNKWLMERYRFARKRMLYKNSGKVNEMVLFHGTSNVPPNKIITSEFGFDYRHCSRGLWGVGTYFAVNAGYSNSYSYKPPGQGQKEMLAAWVLTGESYRCEADGKLRMPPAKSADGEECYMYDTVCGHMGGSDVYVVYDHDKAYPSYLIRYTDN